MRNISLADIVRYILIFLLGLNFSGLVFTSFINPEAYFFGIKLGGINASIYLLANGLVGVAIAYTLLKKKNLGGYSSVLYFGCNFTEVLVTNISVIPNLFFPFYFIISPLYTTGLILSIVFLIIREKQI